MTDATILQFPRNPGAPVVPYPRRDFGLRENGLSALAGSMGNLAGIGRGERAEDRAEIDRVKRAAREARNALDGRHVCPSLVHAVAARAEGLARSASALAEEAKSLGLLKAAVQLREHAALLETLSAEIIAERS